MAGGVFSSAKLYGMTIRESANDGSDFTNPDADYRRLFLGEDGKLHVKDSAGAVTDIDSGTGSVATDAIFDAAGDLVQGTGSNTSARLALGAAGTVVRSTGSTNAYAFPPGHEYSYVEGTTTDTSITGTSEGAADTVVTAAEVTFDGSTVVIIEFYAYSAAPALDAAGRVLRFWLYDGASSIGQMGVMIGAAAADDRKPVLLRRRLTPSGAAHTYSIRSSVSAGTGHIYAGAGGSATGMPLYIRVTKA